MQKYGYAICWDKFEPDCLKDYSASSDKVELSWQKLYGADTR